LGFVGRTPDRIACLAKIRRMSSDWFEKRYLGWAYLPLPTLLMTRHPSEWINPRRRLVGCSATIDACQAASSIRADASSRTVWGEYARPVPPVGVHLDAPDMLHGSNPIEFAVANGCHRATDFLDRVRVSGVLDDPELVRTGMVGDRAVTEIDTEQERVSVDLQLASIASRAR